MFSYSVVEKDAVTLVVQEPTVEQTGHIVHATLILTVCFFIREATMVTAYLARTKRLHRLRSMDSVR